MPHLRREAVTIPAGQVLVAALGADLTTVKCRGQELTVTVGVGVDAVHGLALTIDPLPDGETTTLQSWIAELAAAVGAMVLVTDDADGFKHAADDNGLDHQVCTAHVVRNTDAWIARMAPDLAQDADGSLAATDVAPAQVLADLATLQDLIHTRAATSDGAVVLRGIHLHSGPPAVAAPVSGRRPVCPTSCACSPSIGGNCGIG